MMNSFRVRYGIVGFGGFAEKTIAPAIKASANSELVALQKRSLNAAKEKAAENGVRYAFDSVEKLVACPDVDAVFIVSANSAHCHETLTAAEAGKHVLVEKPMAMNSAEAQTMIDVCKQAHVKLMVGHMVRLSPAIGRMKEIVHSGTIGHVSFIRSEFVYNGDESHRTWHRDLRIAGGGPLFDIGVHCLDTMCYVLNDEVESVKSHLEPIPADARTEEIASLSLRFRNGVVGSIYCSYAAPVRGSYIEIVGTEGIVSAFNFTRSSMNVPVTIMMGSHDEEVRRRVEDMTVGNLYIDEVTLFSECIMKNTDPPIPGEVGLKNQRILDRALEDAKNA